MAIEGYTKDELSSLTSDELSALENDAGDSDGTLEEIAGADDATTASADATTAQEATAAAEPAAEAAADDKTGDAKAAEKTAAEAAKPAAETPADEDAPLNLSRFAPETPDGAAATRAELETRKTEALQKLMDGTIEPDEYKAIDKEVTAKLEDLLSATITDRVTAKITQQEMEKAWNGEVEAAVRAGAKGGIDYAKTPALKAELFELIGAFGVAADRKGMSDKNLEASKWALAQATEVMKLRHGKAAATPVIPAKTEAEEAPATPRHNLKTLGALPSADRTQVNDDVLSKFSTAEGEDIEKLMARMSPADVERLMASV